MSRQIKISIWGLNRMNPHLFDDFILPDGVPKDIVTDKILMDTMDRDTLYSDADVMKRFIYMWSRSRVHVWTRILDDLMQEYSVIENYDRYEDINEKRTGKTDSTGKSVTSTLGTATTDSKSENITDSYTDGTVKDVYSGSNHDINLHSVNGYNDGMQTGTRDERTASDSHTNKQDTDVKVTGKDTGTGSTATLTKGSDTVNTDASGTSADDMEHKAHIHGNIGVTTAPAMITEDIEMRVKFNIVDIIVQEFIGQFISLIY